ncbi:MAG: leucine-rich repeat domain-containing protein [Paludibacteraceae bacterium]|nr:leucine-rich repeat domain-containing protein [Paludibacteraceae bacterium]
MKKLFTLFGIVIICAEYLFAENPEWNQVGKTVSVSSILACHNSGGWIYEEEGYGSETGSYPASFVVLTAAQGRDLRQISPFDQEQIANECGSAVEVNDIDVLYLKPLPDDSEIMGTVAFKHVALNTTMIPYACLRYSIPYQIAKLYIEYDNEGNVISRTVYNYKVTEIVDENISGSNYVNALVIPHTIEYIPKNAHIGFENTDTIWMFNPHCRYEKQNSYGNPDIGVLPKRKVSTIVFGDGFDSIPAFICQGARNLKNIVFPEGVKYMGRMCFAGANLDTIAIPNSVEVVDTSAFQSAAIKHLVFPEGVKKIGIWCCLSAAIEKIDLPSTLSEIGHIAFGECRELKEITIPANNKRYISINGALYTKNIDTLIVYPAQHLTVTIPNTVKYIGTYALSYTRATKIHIPSNVESMAGNPFRGSTTIKEFTIDFNNSNYIVLNGVLYEKYSSWYKTGKIRLKAYPLAKEDSIYIMPQNVASMEESALILNHLKYIELSPKLEGIYELYSEDKDLIQTIVVPCVTPPRLYGTKVWTTLEPRIKVPCNTTDAYLTDSEWQTINSYEEKAFVYVECDTTCGRVSVNNRIVTCGDSVTISAEPKDDYLFVKWDDGSTSPTRVVEAKGVDIYTALFRKVKYSGFCGAEDDGTNLQWSLNIEDSILIITGHGRMRDFDVNNRAPWYQLRLAINAISLSEQLTHLGGEAFRGCSNLKSVTIPNNVTSSGMDPFKSCSSLENPVLNRHVFFYLPTEYAPYYGIYSIPDSIDVIAGGALKECTRLSCVTIPASVTDIGPQAFRSCVGLRMVTIGKNVKNIGDEAFYDCAALTSIVNYALLPQAFAEYDPVFGIYYDGVYDNNYAEYYPVDKSICALYVPRESIEVYKTANGWKDFENILPVEPSSVNVDTTTITPTEKSADIAWPAITKASWYELTIIDNYGNIIGVFVFNEQNRENSIVAYRNAVMQNGYIFSVGGLISNTTYAYILTARDCEENILKNETGDFTTLGSLERIDDIDVKTKTHKLIRDGQVFILRGDKTYTVTGQEVK